MRICNIFSYGLKRGVKLLCTSLLFCVILNYLTELFVFSLYANDRDCLSDFSIICYNVRCSDSHYKDNQIEIAKQILKEAPDIVFFVRVLSFRK